MNRKMVFYGAVLFFAILVILMVVNYQNFTTKENLTPEPAKSTLTPEAAKAAVKAEVAKLHAEKAKTATVEPNRVLYNKYEACMNEAKAVIDGGRKLDGRDMSNK